MPEDSACLPREALDGPIAPCAQVEADHPRPAAALRAALGPAPLAQVFLFASPEADFPALLAEAHTVFAGAHVAACTTAGEIGPGGYAEGTITALGLPAARFATRSLLIPATQEPEQAFTDRLIRARVALGEAHPGKPRGFAFLLVDGLSLREDMLVAAMVPGLGGMPLFGGSAGDGRRFGATSVGLDGRAHGGAAVLTMVRTDCRTKVFSLDHLTPHGGRMVVTGADPSARIVKSINGAPAAAEYARIVGKDPGQLDELTFAAHPVVVRLGGAHHVRSIQRVTPEGDLVFFAAIDDGMVLTIARSEDMAGHLERALAGMAGPEGPPHAILGCDCILRRIEAEQSQATHRVSEVLSRHRVVGFGTYGEQIGPLHVNHTMTGVALYPPPTGDGPC